MFGRRRFALVVLLSLFSACLVTGPSGGSASQSAECVQLSLYTDEIHAAGEQMDAQEASTPDMDHIESWTEADFDQTLAFYDQLLITVQGIEPPPIAAEFHQVYLEGILLVREMFATMRTEGPFAMLGYMEQLGELNQQLLDSSLPLEETCGLALFDHDFDGEPEVGEGVGSDSATPSAVEEPAAASSRTDPIPVGTAAALDNTWELTVLSVTPDANEALLAYHPSNSAPAKGLQYFMVRVKVTNIGSHEESFSNWRLTMEDPSGRIYAPFIDYCGFTPDELPIDTLAPGESAEGNVCWAIPAPEAASTAALVIYDGDAFESERVYFSLDAAVELATGESPGDGFADAIGSAGEGAVSGFGTPEASDDE